MQSTSAAIATGQNCPYAYTFQSSPLPVTRYESMIEVTARSEGASTVTWRGTYTPDQGKEKEASEALAGIYSAGLDTIKARLAKQAL